MKPHDRAEFTRPDGAAGWMASDQQHHEVLVTSRIRVARNVVEFPFKARLNAAQSSELVEHVSSRLQALPFAGDQVFLALDQAEALDAELLFERHLISPELARSSGPRAVAYSRSRNLSVMVNEEDHLRIQVLAAGDQLDTLLRDIQAMDLALSQVLNYATHARFGFLTSCPTNVGTGLRFSVMMHLPALVYSKEIDKEFNAAAKMKLAVRGFYGEGTSYSGDFFQVSNQVTLGKSAEVLLSDLKKVIPTIVEHELEVRRVMQRDHRLDLEDRVFRAYGILRNSRRISSDEARELLSRVRLGVCLGMLEGVDLSTVNELLVVSQPAHVQVMEDREMTEGERDAARAAYLRQRLAGYSNP